MSKTLTSIINANSSITVSPGTSGNVLGSNGTQWVSTPIISLLGVLPTSGGGTGVTSPGTIGNLLTSNGTSWVSSAPVVKLNLGGGSISSNIALGTSALAANTTGSNNLCFGPTAGSAITTGANNVIIGNYTGSTAPVTVSGNSCVVLSDGAGTVRLAVDSNGFMYTSSTVQFFPQTTPVAKTATGALTAADLLGGIIRCTGAAMTLTLPTATSLDATFPNITANNIAFDFYISNSATGTVTLAVNTGITAVGTLTTATVVSTHWRMVRTATATYNIYRL